MQITAATLKVINGALDDSFFGRTAFEIETPDAGTQILLITFRDRPSMKFQLRRLTDLTAVYRPGEFETTREVELKDHDKLVEYLEQWCENILAELKATSPLFHEIDQLRTEFENRLNERFADAQQHFSAQEIQDLQERLAGLEAKFEELREQKNITQSELTEIKKTLSKLTTTLDSMPKKTWMRTAGTKLMELGHRLASSEGGQKLLFDVSQRLLDKGSALIDKAPPTT